VARYSFEIGATQGGMVNLESLATPIIPPDWKFAEYSDEIPLPNGKVRGVGYPLATWHWGYLEKAERTALRTFWLHRRTRPPVAKLGLLQGWLLQ